VTTPTVSLVVLTYNRRELLQQFLRSLRNVHYRPFEVIVVDNHSDDPVENTVRTELPNATFLQMDRNLGIAGRNEGIRQASGDLIITLDDDVTGIGDRAIEHLIQCFRDPAVGAVCFKVVDTDTGKITNWCHHYPVEKYANERFLTNEITEGAVAFRRSALESAGLYPEEFFISHEGPELAYRLMNVGYDVVYSPEIVVRHHHSNIGRQPWRRYYYDTRNLLWLAVRNYPLLYGLKSVGVGLGAMLIYSIRDGFLRYWVKGVLDGLAGVPRAYRQRWAPSQRTISLIRQIDKHRPGFWRMLKKRIFQRQVRI
jgi:GT2 family glycosyltransferase